MRVRAAWYGLDTICTIARDVREWWGINEGFVGENQEQQHWYGYTEESVMRGTRTTGFHDDERAFTTDEKHESEGIQRYLIPTYQPYSHQTRIPHKDLPTPLSKVIQEA